MKHIPLSELEVGKLYLFRHTFNSKRIVLQPGRFIGIHESGRPLVQWCIQGFKSTALVGDGTKVAVELTAKWLQRLSSDLEAQIQAIEDQVHITRALLKEIEA
jgi:hypothetical protein